MSAVATQRAASSSDPYLETASRRSVPGTPGNASRCRRRRCRPRTGHRGQHRPSPRRNPHPHAPGRGRALRHGAIPATGGCWTNGITGPAAITDDGSSVRFLGEGAPPSRIGSRAGAGRGLPRPRRRPRAPMWSACPWVDGSCRTDVTAALQALIDRAEQHRTLRLTPGAPTGLNSRSRSITPSGSRSTALGRSSAARRPAPTTATARTRMLFHVSDSTDVVVRSLTILGPRLSPATATTRTTRPSTGSGWTVSCAGSGYRARRSTVCGATASTSLAPRPRCRMACP